MSVDPVGFVEDNPMSFNRYLYVNNNPYKYVDPDGEFLNFAAKFVLDVGINMAFNYVTTGELNVGGALKESALGVFNPAKTAAKAGDLVSFAVKASKKSSVVKTATSSRVKLRKDTREKIDAAQPRNSAGKKVDPDDGKVLKQGQIDIGHKPGQEWWKRKKMHEQAGSTRKQVIEAENKPRLYHQQDRANNQGHKYEKK